MSILLMVLATRLLTSRWRPSPSARKACAPLAVGICPTRLAGVAVAAGLMLNTSTQSLPVRPMKMNLPSGLPYRSAGMEPVGTRHSSFCVCRSMATSSSLSCMVE